MTFYNISNDMQMFAFPIIFPQACAFQLPPQTISSSSFAQTQSNLCVTNIKRQSCKGESDKTNDVSKEKLVVTLLITSIKSD